MFDTFGSPIRSALFVKVDFSGLDVLPVGLIAALEKPADIDCLQECLGQPGCRSVTLCYDGVTIQCGNNIMNGSCAAHCLCMELVSVCCLLHLFVTVSVV